MKYTKQNTKKHGAKKGKKKHHIARLSKVQPTISYRVILGFMNCLHSIWQAGVNTVNFTLFIITSIINFFVSVVLLPRTIFRKLTRRTRKHKAIVSEPVEEIDAAEECSDPNEGLEEEIEEVEYVIDEELVASNDDARDEAIRALEDRVTQLEKALERMRKNMNSSKRGAIPVPTIMAPPPPVLAIPPPPPPPPMPTPKKANPLFMTPKAKSLPSASNTAAKPSIDIAEIISQRGNLKSATLIPRHRPMVSLSDITNVKLKKASGGVLSEKERASNAPAPVTLRKVDIVRSPGGTPMRRPDENAKTSAKKASPANKQSPLRKVAGAKSPLAKVETSSPIRSPYKAIR